MASGGRDGPTVQSLQRHCGVAEVGSLKMEKYFQITKQMLVQTKHFEVDNDTENLYIFCKRLLKLALDPKGLQSHPSYNEARFKADRLWLQKEIPRVMDVAFAAKNALNEADARAKEAAAAQQRRAAAAAGTASSSDVPNYIYDIPVAPGQDVSPSSSSAAAAAAAAAAHVPGYVLDMPSAPGTTAGGRTADHHRPPQGQGGGRGGPAAAVGDSGADPAAAGSMRGPHMPTAPSAPPPPPLQQRLSLDQAMDVLRGGGEGGHQGNVDGSRRGSGGEDQLYPTVQSPEHVLPSSSEWSSNSSMGMGAAVGMRRIVMPSGLIASFEKLAQANTDLGTEGIETCGILAGRQGKGVLEMTTLIIPKQEGTANTCSTTDEEGLFNYMLANSLITMGWIHTHPSQSCFLSSVDLHTHCSYQLMLPEAVAIVVAPRDQKKRVGVFRLTEGDNSGLKLIQACKLKGFHQHPENIQIYTDVPVEWVQQGALKVVDQR